MRPAGKSRKSCYGDDGAGDDDMDLDAPSSSTVGGKRKRDEDEDDVEDRKGKRVAVEHDTHRSRASTMLVGQGTENEPERRENLSPSALRDVGRGPDGYRDIEEVKENIRRIEARLAQDDEKWERIRQEQEEWQRQHDIDAEERRQEFLRLLHFERRVDPRMEALEAQYNAQKAEMEKRKEQGPSP